MMEEMTVTRALVELKLLDKRILKETVNAIFLSAVRGKETTTVHRTSKEDMEKHCRKNLQSIRAMIERRNIIKTAVVASNASTSVKIAGESYTVAGAIERKGSIQYDEILLMQMRTQFAHLKDQVELANSSVEVSLKTMLEKIAGKEGVQNIDVENISKSYRDTNAMSLFDPAGIEKLIEKLDKEIDEFKADVDQSLSECNAVTKITINVG